MQTIEHFDTPLTAHCISVMEGNFNKNRILLVNVQTGGAKTWWTFNCAIPRLLNEYGVQLICYTYPYSEIYEEEKVMDAITQAGNVVHLKIEHTTSNKLLKTVEGYIRAGMRVLITSTNNSFFAHGTQQYGDRILEFCKEMGIRPALFVDEVHQWSTSDINQYRYNTGNNTPEFNASLYGCVSEWAKWSPYVIGLTATLTPEQKTNNVLGDTKYEVLVNPLPIQQLIYKSAWLDKFKYYDVGNEMDEFYRFINEFENTNRSLLDWSNYSYQKNKIYETSMIIRVEANPKKVKNKKGKKKKVTFNKTHVLSELKSTLIYMFRGGYLKMGEYSIAVMDQTGCYIYDLKGNVLKKTDDEIKEMLNDKNNPLRYLIVVERGKSGMNVSTLKWYFDFRRTTKFNDDGWIITNLLQLCGRLQRLNPYGWDIQKFIKKYGYDLQKYISELISEGNDSLLNKLFITNSYRVCVPNLPNWKEVESTLEREISNTLSTVKQIISSGDDTQLIQQSYIQAKITLESSRKYLDSINPSDIQWSDTYNVTDTIEGLTNMIGVYQFIYKPTGEVLYIGYSRNIANRRSKHMTSFRLGGASENPKSYFKSIVGVKMSEFDSNGENYGFRWMDVGDEIFAKEIELNMIRHYSPRFNSEYMGGK